MGCGSVQMEQVNEVIKFFFCFVEFLSDNVLEHEWGGGSSPDASNGLPHPLPSSNHKHGWACCCTSCQ